MIPRSYLYVPGARPDRFAKAVASGADAVIFDLEDSVPVTAKARARAAVADFLRAAPSSEPPGPELWVRVNSGEVGIADTRAVAAGPALTGLCLAKAEGTGQLAELDRLLTMLGSTASVEPLLETAAAVLAAGEIATAPRVRRLQIGEADLAADLAVEPSRDGIELLWARSAVVAASAAAGLDPPAGSVSTEFTDLASYAESTRALRRLGFWGRACIHPAQVPVTHQVFTSSKAELAWAAAVIASLADAERSGQGVATGPDGRLVDEAVARIARRVLARQPAPSARPAEDAEVTEPAQVVVDLRAPRAAWTSVPIPDSAPEVQTVTLGPFRTTPGGSTDTWAQPGSKASSGGLTLLVRFPPGWQRATQGSYEVDEEFVVLDGMLELNGERYTAGDYGWLPAKSIRHGTATPTGALVIAWFHGPPRWRAGTNGNHDHVRVRLSEVALSPDGSAGVPLRPARLSTVGSTALVTDPEPACYPRELLWLADTRWQYCAPGLAPGRGGLALVRGWPAG